MKNQLKMTMLLCAVTAICTAGCARHELVQDHLLPPGTTETSAQSVHAGTRADVHAPARALEGIAQQGAGNGSSPKELQAATLTQKSAAAGGTEVTLQNALEKVLFAFDSYTLSAQARKALTKNAEVLKKQAHGKIRIEGNCDELGSDEYNLALGERRADAALKYLKALGIPAERISTISYGKEKPAVAGHDAASRAANRRDEFVVGAN